MKLSDGRGKNACPQLTKWPRQENQSRSICSEPFCSCVANVKGTRNRSNGEKAPKKVRGKHKNDSFDLLPFV
jgi:hypothetical protein